MAMTISGNDGLTFPAGSTQVQAGNYQSMVNRIINGRMEIDQRNAGASVTITSNSTYTLDRWIANINVSSKFSVQQNAGSVTPPVGFSNYLGVTSLSAYSIGSGDILTIGQFIEGFNTSDLGWGTANAKTVTLSFQVRSSLTGTFGGAIRNDGNDRSYPFTYTISSANTWTTISVTIAGDTSGTWVGSTNGIGMRIFFGLGVGSSVSGTAGAWASANYWSVTGATSVVGTNGATFYITGVDLRVGSYTVVPQDFRAYGTELQLCQRYFTKSFATTTAPANSSAAPYEGVGASFIGGYFSSNFIAFPATMKSVPTLTYYSSANGTPSNGVWQIYDGGWANASSLNGSNITVNGFQNSWVYSSATVKGAYYISGHFIASAEL